MKRPEREVLRTVGAVLTLDTMKRAWSILVSSLVLGAIALVAAPAPVGAADGGGPAPVGPCVTLRAEARYGAAAYNHIVVLTNACDKAEDCSVTTDVNPEPITVTVPGHGVAEAMTFLGSPSRVFVPKARCVPVK
jgi:hypothetical protein